MTENAIPRRTDQSRHRELIGPAMLLEPVAVDMAYGRFLPFASLPQVFLSSEIEFYANFTSDLTQADPKKREHDGFLFVRKPNDRFLFHHKPRVGTNNSTDPDTWRLPDPSIGLLPSVHIHSHPADVCHSPARADMEVLMRGIGNSGDSFVPPALLVATPEHNYLMIKSAETPVIDKDYELDGAIHESTKLDEKDLYQDPADLVGHPVNAAQAITIEGLQKKILGGDSLRTHYDNFMGAIYLAEAYNLGFYRSDNDGQYVRMTREMVWEQLTQTREKVVTAIKARLAQAQI